MGEREREYKEVKRLRRIERLSELRELQIANILKVMREHCIKGIANEVNKLKRVDLTDAEIEECNDIISLQGDKLDIAIAESKKLGIDLKSMTDELTGLRIILEDMIKMDSDA